jgi:hypothetical protein
MLARLECVNVGNRWYALAIEAEKQGLRWTIRSSTGSTHLEGRVSSGDMNEALGTAMASLTVRGRSR